MAFKKLISNNYKNNFKNFENASNDIVVDNFNETWWSFCHNFGLNLKNLGLQYKEYIKIAKNGGFCEKSPSENDCKAVLTNFDCYGCSDFCYNLRMFFLFSVSDPFLHFLGRFRSL